MSNKERIGVILDVSADVGKIEGSLSSLRNHLSGIQLPKGIGKELETRMSKLSDEIKNFQNLASKAGDSFEGAKQIDASYKKILEYARKVENSFSAIKDEANIDASKFFPKDVLDRIEKAEGAMADYYKAIEKGNESLTKQKKELKDIQSALDKNKKHQSELLAKQSGKKASRDAVVQEQTKVKTDKTAERDKEQQSLEILNKRKIALEAEKAAVENLTKKREAYNKAIQTYASKDTEEAANKISSASAAYAEAEEVAKQYGSTIRSISEIKLEQSNVATEISTTKAAIKSLGDEITAADTKIKKADEGYNSLTQELKENEAAAESFEQQMATLRTEIEQTEKAARAQGLQTLAKTLNEIGIKVDPAVNSIEAIQNTINNLKPEAVQAMSAALDKAGVDVNELGINLDKVGDKNKAFQEGAQSAKQMNDQVEQLKGQVQQFFSLTNSVMLFRRGVQQAIETVKELDAAMTETAVVTDFSVGDMWDALPRYTQTANELGTTTLGAYETMTLFYQQGLDTNEAFEVGTETMKMARIAGLEYADATNLMTAALRGFNMELNETSAARVNDVYSELAAITAADTEEIATAMTKTASIAANANMEFETTAALLSQIIETTREPAETAGTAMKTIIARFTEMKKSTSDLINVDGEEVSVNKVEDALRSAGVALRDVNGEFRDLDDVFLELSSKWNNLDKMTQRYVATMAAGSRQQSRFIAMMSDYDRTMELVGAAYNSSGASQKQFEKTQDSLESKLNKLKNAWNEFLMGISNSKVIKAGVDALTGLLNIVNKLTGNSGIAKLAVAIGTLKVGRSIFEGLFRSLAPFGKQIGKAGENAGTSFISGLVQKINNFKKGDGFKTDIDIQTGVAHGKIAALRTDLKSLYASIVQPVIPAGTITGFQILDGKIIATAVNAEGATETIEVGMSQVALKAFGAAMAADEVGDEIAESGISGKMALDILQKEYDELIARQLIAKKLGNNKRADNLGNQADDVSRLRDMLRNGQNKEPTNFWNAMKNGATKFMGKLIPLAPMIAALTVEVGLLAAAWYFSPEQTLKRQIEDATNAAKSANEVFDNVNASLNELTNYRTDLETIQDGFDGLVEGTSAWRAQLAKANSLVMEIIRKYPELAQYQFYEKNGQLDLTEEGWEQVIQKQSESAALASTTNSIAAARVDQLNSELMMYQDLEIKQNELAGNWDEGLGGTTGAILGGLGAWGGVAAASSIVSSIGVAALGGGFGGGALAGAIAGATAGTVVPVIGNIIGGLTGLIAGAAIGYGVYRGVQNTKEDSEEYQQYKKELEEKQKIERENRLQQYSAAMYNQFSADEEMGEDKNLAAATELMAEKLEANITSASADMGLDDWTTDGANKEEIQEWAENLGYTVKNDKVYDQSGELVFKIEKFGDAHEGEEGWITNEQIAQQLATQRATSVTKEETKQLLDLMGTMDSKLDFEEGTFNELFLEEDLSGSSIRKLMNTDFDTVSSELTQMSALTGQDMKALMATKKAQAQRQHELLISEMTAYSALFNKDITNFDDYEKEFDAWQKSLTDKQYAGLIDQYSSIKETMGVSAAGFFVDALKENNEDLNKIQGVFNNIDFSNPIAAYADLKKAAEETSGSIKETAEGMLELGTAQNKIDKGSQWRYFFNSQEFAEVRQSLDEIRNSTEQITAENIYKLAESNVLLRDMLNSGAAGAQSLLTAIEGLEKGLIDVSDLTGNFVEALSELNALADLTAKSFNKIDNLNLSRSSTEISEFWSNAKLEMLELYEKGAYGDQRLIDYVTQMIGVDNWKKALENSTDGYRGALKTVMSQISDDTISMYSDWVRAAPKLDFVSLNSQGSVIFDFEKMKTQFSNTEEMVAGIADKLGLSKDYVEAMVVDLSTFSSDFRLAYEQFSGQTGLQTLLEGAGTYSSNGIQFLNVSREQLQYFVEDVDEFVEKWNSLGKVQINPDIEFLTDNGDLTDELKTIIGEDISILAKADIDPSDAERTLLELEGKKLTFQSEFDFYKAANEMYTHLLDTGMLEDDARAALEGAFSKEYDVYIAGDKLTSEVLNSTLDGVQNHAITYASIKQAEIVGEVYYQAVYKAMVAAIRGTMGAIPGFEQYAFYDGAGNRYTTNQNLDEWSTTSSVAVVTYADGTSEQVTRDNDWIKNKDGRWYKNDISGSGFTYIYDDSAGKVTKIKPDIGAKEQSTGITVSSDVYKTVTATDANGKVTPVTIKNPYGIYDNQQSPINSLPDDPPEWSSTVGDEYRVDILREHYSYDENEDLDTQWSEFLKTEEGKRIAAATIYDDPDSRELAGEGGQDKDGDGIVDYEKESDRIKAKLDEIETAIKDLADNDITDMRLVNQLIDQKIALQKEYKKTLEEELALMQQSIPEIWSRVQASGNSKYIEYNEETKLYGYTQAFEDDFLENGVPVESKELQEKMREVQDQINQLNKVGSDQLANQIAIKELVDNLVRNSAEDYNTERSLKGRERRQTAADEEEALIGRLPEEIQGPLMMMNTAEDAFLEYSEIQSNKVLAENMQQELDATYAQIPDAIKEYITFDEYSGYGIDLGKIYTNIQDPEAQDDMIQRVQGNAQILNDKYDPLYDVLEQLDGGKVQKAIQGMAKASKTASRALKDQDKATDHLNDAFNELENKLGLNEDALDGFANALGDAIKSSEFLQGEFKGLGIKDIEEKINKSPIAGLLSDDQKSALTQILGEGGQRGDILGSLFGGGSDFLNGLGDIATFDMMNIGMDMFDTAKGMIDQGKQMIEKIIGYITQATQVIVDAWTNREDYLYNFLKVIEKHLQEYEKLQRYQNQLEKGRTSSVAEIRATYDEQWKSLQLQLEEQTERLETRQEELDRSRWNPFSLISGWDPTTDTLYENRSVKFAWDLLIGFSSMLPMGLGAFGQQLNQLYEDYDQRVQNSYEDRLAAEQALLDIEDERLELVKYGSEEATEFENKILEAMVQKEQEQIDELTRLNDAITDANSKLISTLQDNLDKMRQDRENEKKEEELGEKERRLAYLRQDTSGANMMEIKKLEEQLEEEHEDYTDTLIDQKISELEKQNELAAEQRQQQIDLLQGQLDYAEKYGLYWDAIYGMLYTIDENGNAVLNPENFDLDGNIRENSQLAQMLGTFSDRLGMSVWSSVLDNEEMKRLGRYYGFFIGNNGVTGNWRHQWALDDPGANDPNYAQPEVEIPDGIWGVIYKLEMLLRERSINNNPDLINRAGRAKQWLRNGIGNLFGIEDWAEYKYEYISPAHVQPTIAMDMKETSDSINAWFANGLGGIIKDSKGRVSVGGTQNNGDQNITNYFNIGTVGENISLDDMVDRVSSAIRGLFTSDGVGSLQKKR